MIGVGQAVQNRGITNLTKEVKEKCTKAKAARTFTPRLILSIIEKKITFFSFYFWKYKPYFYLCSRLGKVTYFKVISKQEKIKFFNRL
jgi:hypothetical protein